MGWAGGVRADPPSLLLAVMGWEAADIAPSCPVPSGKLLCGSWRCRLEGMVPFFLSLGRVGMQSLGVWNLSFLLQWLFSGCYGLDFDMWTGCAALGVKDCISWLVGTQEEAPALKGMLCRGFMFLSSSNLKSLKKIPSLLK